MTEKKKATPKPKAKPEKKTAKKSEAKKETKATPKATAPKTKTASPTKGKAEAKDVKADAKKEKKEVKATSKKYIQKVAKSTVKKSKEALEAQKMLKGKKKHPTFRGRFGKKNIRRKSKAKWDKWRKPRSIDLDRGLQHGYRPKIGYGNPAAIKGIHASGYKEVRVENVADLGKIDPKTQAARIGSTVGKKKRNDIVTLANEKNIKVLN